MQENPWVTVRAGKKAAHKLLTVTDVLGKISPQPLSHHHHPVLPLHLRHPSLPPTSLSASISWERAARGDPGLLNLLPKTLLLKRVWLCACVCVCVYLHVCLLIRMDSALVWTAVSVSCVCWTLMVCNLRKHRRLLVIRWWSCLKLEQLVNYSIRWQKLCWLNNQTFVLMLFLVSCEEKCDVSVSQAVLAQLRKLFE